MRVFCYGTLRRGYPNHWVIKPFVASIELGVIRGTMHDGPGFPYVVQHGNGLVQGEWVSIHPGSESKALSAMDCLEGYRGAGQDNHYDRVLTQDALEPNIEGWLYVAGLGPDVHKRYPVIISGDWAQREALPYFAYGSCMNEVDFRRTCPTAKNMGTAKLPGYQRRFNGYSVARRGGITNIERKKGAAVEGVLWQIRNERERFCLDAREGVPRLYCKTAVRISLPTRQYGEGRWIMAFTYQLRNPFFTDWQPSLAYLKLLVNTPISDTALRNIVIRAIRARPQENLSRAY